MPSGNKPLSEPILNNFYDVIWLGGLMPTAPSHYLNQCWLIISRVLWHSHESIFTGMFKISICKNSLKITLLKLLPHSPGPFELNQPIPPLVLKYDGCIAIQRLYEYITIHGNIHISVVGSFNSLSSQVWVFPSAGLIRAVHHQTCVSCHWLDLWYTVDCDVSRKCD